MAETYQIRYTLIYKSFSYATRELNKI